MQKLRNMHYTQEGSEYLGKKVAESITQALAK